MIPLIKLFFLTITPLIAGYLFRINFGSYFSSLFFVAMVLGAALVLPMTIEMIYKSKIQKPKIESGVKISKISGFTFIFGIVLCYAK